MAKNNRITFYDLALSTGATISPFVWATKFAVAHKGFEMDVVPGGFTGIRTALALAEGMSEAEFQSRFTSTESATFAATVARIDQTLAVRNRF